VLPFFNMIETLSYSNLFFKIKSCWQLLFMKKKTIILRIQNVTWLFDSISWFKHIYSIYVIFRIMNNINTIHCRIRQYAMKACKCPFPIITHLTAFSFTKVRSVENILEAFTEKSIIFSINRYQTKWSISCWLSYIYWD
jgi:hypothetical protein